MTSLGSGSFKSQLKQTDRLGVRWIILWGENEKKSNQVLVKELSTGSQDAVDIGQLLQWFKSRC
jgi:histidyl-tRNA synthetase